MDSSWSTATGEMGTDVTNANAKKWTTYGTVGWLYRIVGTNFASWIIDEDVSYPTLVFTSPITTAISGLIGVLTGEDGDTIPLATAKKENTYYSYGWLPGIWDIVEDTGFPYFTTSIFDGGIGTDESPYIISTYAQLIAIANNMSAVYELAADIDLAESFEPIGLGSTISFNESASTLKLLLKMEGGDGSTDFLDSSPSAHTVTANGNAQIDQSEYKMGISSYLGDGSGDYLSIPDSTDFSLGSNDFTIECYFKLNSYPAIASYMSIISQRNAASTNAAFTILIKKTISTCQFFPEWSYDGTTYINAPTDYDFQLDTWYHICWQRDGNWMQIFVDGVMIDEWYVGTNSIYNSSEILMIGCTKSSGSIAYSLDGWIDSLALYNGEAKYPTTSLEPTDTLTADDDTVLLLHCEGTDGSTTFTDSSASAHTVTAGGNGQIDTDDFKFGTSSYLGDGSGDYLSVPDSTDWNVGSDSFTIECWVKANSFPNTYNAIFSQRYSYNSDAGLTCFIKNNSGTMQLFTEWTYNGYTRYNLIVDYPFVIDTWYHIVWQRYGRNMMLFVNGHRIGYLDIGTTTIYNSSETFMIGCTKSSGSINYSWDGWIDEFRFTKGVARYFVGDASSGIYGVEPFKGKLYGEGYAITGDISVLDAGINYIGLFGQLYDAYIISICLNVSVEGNKYVGALAGSSYSSHILWSSVYGSSNTIDGKDCVGGFIGKSVSDVVQNNRSHPTISGDDYVGGIYGYSDNSAMYNCIASGNINGNDYIGGLAGSSNYASSIQSFALMAAITGNGSNYGRICGSGTIGSYAYALSTMTFNGGSFSGSGTDGTDVTEANAKKEATYTPRGFVFGTTLLSWKIDEDASYPYLFTIATGAVIKVYNGGAWEIAVLKVYNDGSWETATLQKYDSGAWS